MTAALPWRGRPQSQALPPAAKASSCQAVPRQRQQIGRRDRQPHGLGVSSRRHHGAQGGRIRREQELRRRAPRSRAAQSSVLSDHVGAAAHQGDLGRICRSKLDRLDVEIGGLVEARAALITSRFPKTPFLFSGSRDAQGVGGFQRLTNQTGACGQSHGGG